MNHINVKFFCKLWQSYIFDKPGYNSQTIIGLKYFEKLAKNKPAKHTGKWDTNSGFKNSAIVNHDQIFELCLNWKNNHNFWIGKKKRKKHCFYFYFMKKNLWFFKSNEGTKKEEKNYNLTLVLLLIY